MRKVDYVSVNGREERHKQISRVALFALKRAIFQRKWSRGGVWRSPIRTEVACRLN